MTSETLYRRSDGSVIGPVEYHRAWNAARRTFTHLPTGYKFRGPVSALPWPLEECDVSRPLDIPSTPTSPKAQRWRNEEFDKDYASTRNYFRKLDRQHDRDLKAGYVYLATNGRGVKIGESVNPDRRVGQANTWALPGEEWAIVTAWFVADRKKAEKDMHFAFEAFNLRLELFRLDPMGGVDVAFYENGITNCLRSCDHV